MWKRAWPIPKSAMTPKARVRSKALSISRAMGDVAALVETNDLEEALGELSLACDALRSLTVMVHSLADGAGE